MPILRRILRAAALLTLAAGFPLAAAEPVALPAPEWIAVSGDWKIADGRIAELSDDYLSHSGRYARFFVGRFMEAPAMFKKDGKYYLIMSGCTGWAPNPGRSAVAESIWGPWKELANPFFGTDSTTSFHSQSTYVLPVPGKPDQFIYMGDRWTPDNAIDGRYIWLPLRFEGEQPVIEWRDEWKY